MLTISQAVREALKDFQDPLTASRSQITFIANKKLKDSGNTKDEVNDHNVTQVRIAIMNRLNKSSLNREDIIRYEKDFLAKSAHGIHQKNNALEDKEVKYKSSFEVIRAALLQVDDPEKCPSNRIQAIAVSLLTQSGQRNLAEKTNATLISACRKKLRYYSEGTITKEKIEQYNQHLASGDAYSRNGKQAKGSIQSVRPIGPTYTLLQVQASLKFARELGGFEDAISILNVLKEGGMI